MRFLYKYATRARPHLVRQVIARYCEYLSREHDFKFVISCDIDDPAMNNPSMCEFLSAQSKVEFHFNPPPQTKITAINANLENQGFDILVNISDDQIPVVKGFDAIIAADMQRLYGDQPGALWYHDGGEAKDRICTLSIMNFALFEKMGRRIYREEYENTHCDDEWTAHCRQMNCITYFPKTIIAHGWVKITGIDELHKRNDKPERFARDQAMFERRKAAGFPS